MTRLSRIPSLYSVAPKPSSTYCKRIWHAQVQCRCIHRICLVDCSFVLGFRCARDNRERYWYCAATPSTLIPIDRTHPTCRTSCAVNMARLTSCNGGHLTGISRGGPTPSLHTTTAAWRSASATAHKMPTAARAITGPAMCRGDYSRRSMDMSFVAQGFVAFWFVAYNFSHHTVTSSVARRPAATHTGTVRSFYLCDLRDKVCAPHPRLCCVSPYSAPISSWHMHLNRPRTRTRTRTITRTLPP